MWSRRCASTAPPLTPQELEYFESFDLIYRSLCGILYNYVPTSGHPGGSISSGRFVGGHPATTRWTTTSAAPTARTPTSARYAAGHKALGLYAMWALRNEVLRIGAPDLLPGDETQQLRLEDLLGFRRNPINRTPLFSSSARRRSTGTRHRRRRSSGCRPAHRAWAIAASIGLAWGAKDYFGAQAPRVHIVEGEGGMTPGRVAEALAAAGTACLDNAVLHVDWNQASHRLRTASAGMATSPATTSSGTRSSWRCSTTGT